MNKLLRRFLSFVLVFIFVFVAVDTSINAASEVTDIGSARYYVDEVIRETNLPYGVYQHTDISYTSAKAGEVTSMGTGITDSFVADKYYKQQVNVLEVPSTSEIKVTPWAYLSQGAWNLRTVKTMAKDFELKNPGYKVVAAINADFFDINSNKLFPKTPSGAHVSGGEFYKTLSGSAVGFTNNGTTKSLVGNATPQRDQYMTLSVYDANGNVIKDFTINKINQEPVENEISIYYGKWTLEAGMPSQKLAPIDVKNAIIVDNGEYALPSTNRSISNTGPTTEDFYGRGFITSIGDATLDTGDFAIKSNNPEVIEALKVGVKIRAQYTFTGAFEGVNDVVGVGQTVLYDGLKTGSDTNRHPRTMVGVKEDGTLLMTVVDGRQQSKQMYGASQAEMAAILKHYGAVEGYNLDGGGSSTMIILNDGEFEVTNSPSDGTERSDSNCILITVKVPEVETTFKNISTSSLTMNLNVKDNNGINTDELYVKLNNEIKKVENNEVTFENLNSNTEYAYELLNKINGEYNNLVISGRTITGKNLPKVNFAKVYFDGANLIFDINLDDPDAAVLRRSVMIGDQTSLITSGKAVFNNFEGEIFNDTIIKISYDINDGNGRVDIELTEYKIQCSSDIFFNLTLSRIENSILGIYN